jgi:predicted nucleotidyltransferase
MFDHDVVLYPYRTTPRRIADDVVAALAAAPEVAAISLFGSLAAGTWDGLSDVDVLVAHEGGEEDAWTCAAAIRAAMPVRFYRMFSGVEQPAGRYWFWGESPFHHVDVSFHPAERYEVVRRDGVREGFPISAREVFRRSTSDAPTPIAPPGPVDAAAVHSLACHIGERERSVGAAVYTMLYRTKQYLRAHIDRAAYDDAYREFLRGAAGVGRDEPFAGGALGDLVQECLALRLAIERQERGG